MKDQAIKLSAINESQNCAVPNVSHVEGTPITMFCNETSICMLYIFRNTCTSLIIIVTKVCENHDII